MAVTLWTLDPDTLATVTELTHSYDRGFTLRLNDAGVGRFRLPASSAQTAAVAVDSLIRFDIDGSPEFTMVVEDTTVVAVDPAEGAGQTHTYTGRGLMVEWEDTVVAPALGWDRLPFSDRRVFNFAEPSFDDSAWANAVATTTNTGQIGPGGAPVPPALLQPPQRPEGFPTYYTAGAGGAFWIWDRDSAGPSVPAGWVYLRKPPGSFVLPSDLKLHIEAAGDDALICYIDGIPVLREPGWYRGQTVKTEIDLDAGEHWVAVAGQNQNAHKAGVLFTAVAIDGAGPLLLPGALSSDEDWLALGYPPSVPGYTPGALVARLLTEAQADGDLTGWSLTSTATDDSEATPWPNELEFACDVGQSLYSILEVLAETDIDFAPTPTRSLDLVVAGNLGVTPAVTLAAGVNLEGLHHEIQRPIVNSFGVRWAEGQFRREDAGSVASHGRRASMLRLEAYESRVEAERVVDALLAVTAEPRAATSAVVLPAGGDVPLVDFGLGDSITCDDESGTPTAMRVRSITMQENDEGVITWPVELRNGLLEEEDRINRVIRRATAGAFGGRSEAVSFVPPKDTPTAEDFGTEAPVFSHPGAISAGITGEYTFRTQSRIIGATVRCGAGSSDTVIAVFGDGAGFATITIPAASTFVEFDEAHADWPDLGKQFYRLSSLYIDTTSAGGHTNPVIQFVAVR